MSNTHTDFTGTYITDTGEVRFGRVLLIKNDEHWSSDDFTEVLQAHPYERLRLAKKIAKFYGSIQNQVDQLRSKLDHPTMNVRVFRVDEDGVEEITELESDEEKENPED